VFIRQRSPGLWGCLRLLLTTAEPAGPFAGCLVVVVGGAGVHPVGSRLYLAQWGVIIDALLRPRSGLATVRHRSPAAVHAHVGGHAHMAGHAHAGGDVRAAMHVVVMHSVHKLLVLGLPVTTVAANGDDEYQDSERSAGQWADHGDAETTGRSRDRGAM